MDLNTYPQSEDDEDAFGPHFDEDNGPSHVDHVERVESAVEIARRERDERRERLKRQQPDDRPARRSQPSLYDRTYAKSNKSYDRSKLPPGWLGCPAAGQEIACMVPSKVPLGEFFNDCIPPGKRYSFKQVIHQQRVLGRKLGLVIDLTNTTRYYSPEEWKKEGIKHVKIQCKGRDSVPDNEAVNQFVFEVLQFLARQKQPKKCILVHCTHGHNRTGYMIVHYLMRTLPMSVSEAIKAFAKARSPGIYKPDYIEALYNFYHEKTSDVVECPPTPEWKRLSDLDLNGDAVPDDDDDGNRVSSVQENVNAVPVMTLDDVLGDSIPFAQQETFRKFCHHSLNLGVGGRGNAQFPGSHPVSLNRENLQLLRQRYYYATWKADGTRYMMLITMDGCYLIDRHFNFRRVQMRFPRRGTNEALAERTHHYTLLDGEMVIDSLPDSKHERRYLIYDMIAINQEPIVQLPFYERWKMIEREVIEPRNYERQNVYKRRNPYYRYDLEPFRVRRKDFWLLSTVGKVLNEFIPKLSHDSDGLIFQGWDDSYVPRTHKGLLKWKYAEMNSVDFLFEMIDGRESLYLYERGKKKLMQGNRVIFNESYDPTSCSGKIIECTRHKDEKDVWVCMRIRTDKGTPNDFTTYTRVMQSINDNITQASLLEEINEIVRLPMYANRIRNDCKAHPRGKRKIEELMEGGGMGLELTPIVR